SGCRSDQGGLIIRSGIRRGITEVDAARTVCGTLIRQIELLTHLVAAGIGDPDPPPGGEIHVDRAVLIVVEEEKELTATGTGQKGLQRRKRSIPRRREVVLRSAQRR